MGNCNNSKDVNFDDVQTLPSKTDFHMLFVKGRGGFERVWKTEIIKTKQLYAVKELCKCKMISISSVVNEMYLLNNLRHRQHALFRIEKTYIQQ